MIDSAIRHLSTRLVHQYQVSFFQQAYERTENSLFTGGLSTVRVAKAVPSNATFDNSSWEFV